MATALMTKVRYWVLTPSITKVRYWVLTPSITRVIPHGYRTNNPGHPHGYRTNNQGTLLSPAALMTQGRSCMATALLTEVSSCMATALLTEVRYWVPYGSNATGVPRRCTSRVYLTGLTKR